MIEAAFLPADPDENVLRKALEMHDVMRAEGLRVPLLYYSDARHATHPFSVVQVDEEKLRVDRASAENKESLVLPNTAMRDAPARV